MAKLANGATVTVRTFLMDFEQGTINIECSFSDPATGVEDARFFSYSVDNAEVLDDDGNVVSRGDEATIFWHAVRGNPDFLEAELITRLNASEQTPLVRADLTEDAAYLPRVPRV